MSYTMRDLFNCYTRVKNIISVVIVLCHVLSSTSLPCNVDSGLRYEQFDTRDPCPYGQGHTDGGYHLSGLGQAGGGSQLSGLGQGHTYREYHLPDFGQGHTGGGSHLSDFGQGHIDGGRDLEDVSSSLRWVTSAEIDRLLADSEEQYTDLTWTPSHQQPIHTNPGPKHVTTGHRHSYFGHGFGGRKDEGYPKHHRNHSGDHRQTKGSRFSSPKSSAANEDKPTNNQKTPMPTNMNHYRTQIEHNQLFGNTFTKTEEKERSNESHENVSGTKYQEVRKEIHNFFGNLVKNLENLPTNEDDDKVQNWQQHETHVGRRNKEKVDLTSRQEDFENERQSTENYMTSFPSPSDTSRAHGDEFPWSLSRTQSNESQETSITMKVTSTFHNHSLPPVDTSNPSLLSKEEGNHKEGEGNQKRSSTEKQRALPSLYENGETVLQQRTAEERDNDKGRDLQEQEKQESSRSEQGKAEEKQSVKHNRHLRERQEPLPAKLTDFDEHRTATPKPSGGVEQVYLPQETSRGEGKEEQVPPKHNVQRIIGEEMDFDGRYDEIERPAQTPTKDDQTQSRPEPVDQSKGGGEHVRQQQVSSDLDGHHLQWPAPPVQPHWTQGHSGVETTVQGPSEAGKGLDDHHLQRPAPPAQSHWTREEQEARGVKTTVQDPSEARKGLDDHDIDDHDFNDHDLDDHYQQRPAPPAQSHWTREEQEYSAFETGEDTEMEGEQLGSQSASLEQPQGDMFGALPCSRGFERDGGKCRPVLKTTWINNDFTKTSRHRRRNRHKSSTRKPRLWSEMRSR